MTILEAIDFLNDMYEELGDLNLCIYDEKGDQSDFTCGVECLDTGNFILVDDETMQAFIDRDNKRPDLRLVE